MIRWQKLSGKFYEKNSSAVEVIFSHQDTEMGSNGNLKETVNKSRFSNRAD